MNAPAICPVFVVLPPRVLLLDVAGPVEALRRGNLAQDRLRFEATYVAPRAEVSSSIGLGLSGVRPLPAKLPNGALVIVPGAAEAPMGPATSPREDDARAEAEIVGWLAEVVRPGVTLATICEGALLAARAGLLEGFACTTHHASVAKLTRLAPRSRVAENRLFVVDGERWTSAGASTGIDMMLHYLAERLGAREAAEVARFLVVYMRRCGEDPQLSPYLQGRNHLDPVVHRAQDAVVANPTRDWSVAELAKIAGASPRHLSRLFGLHSGLSVSGYVSAIRVAAARNLIAEQRLDIETVAERSGFGSARQLRRAWRQFYPDPPSRYRPQTT